MAISFQDRRELDWARNDAWFEDHGWDRIDLLDHEIATWAAQWLRRVTTGRTEAARVAIDVSSMSRLRIGAVVQALLTLPPDARAEVDILYTPSTFPAELPEGDYEPQVFDVAPVSDYFAGWWTDLAAPLVAVIGVGYELEMAASAIDKLEPEGTIVFVPDRDDPAYAAKVRGANYALMDTGGVDPSEVQYKVADPFACFRLLEATVAKLEQRFRIAIVPLGPKIYAACAMLVAGLHPATSQAIRVTAGSRQAAINRTSNGKLYGLTVLVNPPPVEQSGASS